MLNKCRVIISTNGPLHLIKSAEYLSHYVDIKVVQGWIPTWWNRWVLAFASKLVGRNLYKSFERRTPECLKGKNHSAGIGEFYVVACKIFRLQSPMKSQYIAAKIYGHQSKKYITCGDVIHVRSGSGLGGAIEKAKANGIKVVVDHSIAHPFFIDKQLRDEYEKHGVLFDMGMDNPYWVGILEDCKKADIVLVNSQFVKTTFVKNGFDPDKIKVQLLGVRKDFYSLKQSYELKNGMLRILFTGGFGIRKGAEYILRALAKLDTESFSYEFTCVGDSSGAVDLINSIGARHVTCVSFIPQEDLKLYLANSDIYLFPSLCEGCASSGMEAMAAGLPVIATEESGLPIENGENGILVESKNVEAITNALKKIALDKSLREKLGKSAAKYIAENFTWEQYAQNVVKIYHELVD